jgi:phosphatidylinositol alpha-1,6-mannosyltransferase
MVENNLEQSKTLCITNDFGPRAGGIETFVVGLIQRMPKNSVIVYTASQADSVPFDEMWLRDYGVEVIRDASKVLLPSFRVGRNVRKLVRERNIEFVFFGAAAPLALLAPGLRTAGVKRIVALTHGHEVWWSRLWPFSWAIARIGRSVDALTYLGDFTRGEIAKALNPDSIEKLVRIAPGIDTEHFTPRSDAQVLRQSLGLVDKKVIVSVGRLVHRKGQDVLIAAMPEIITSIPDAHLLLIGEGPYKQELEKRIKNLGLANRVTFVGRVQYEELPRYICVGDVFAMPSRSRLAGLEVEGLGIVYLEASACGLPVIGGISGGAPDAVLQGETGFAVDGTSAQEVARAVVKVLADKELAQKLGTRGRQWIIEQWQWQMWSERFNQLLK